MPKKFTQTEPLVDQLSPAARARIIEADIREALDDGRFEFVQGYLKRVQLPGTETCVFGGCAIAALAFAVGCRPDTESGTLTGWRCQEAAVDTGLITQREGYELEDGYEGELLAASGAFAALGRRLRRLARRRGGRYILERFRSGDQTYTVYHREP